MPVGHKRLGTEQCMLSRRLCCLCKFACAEQLPHKIRLFREQVQIGLYWIVLLSRNRLQLSSWLLKIDDIGSLGRWRHHSSLVLREWPYDVSST